MLFCDLKGIDLKVMMYGNLLKDLFRFYPEIAMHNPRSVRRRLHQMVFRIIDRMAGPFQFHAERISYVFLPSAGELFIPVYKTGYSSFGSS